MSLHRFTEVRKKPTVAIDKKLGRVKDIFFDDIAWRVRYFAIDTHRWMPGRKVLVSPESVRAIVDHAPIPISQTNDELIGAPVFDDLKPISRQYETALHQHYGWRTYWEPHGFIDPRFPYGQYLNFRYGSEIPPGVRQALEQRIRTQDANLRSCKEILGYKIGTTDGIIGTVEDFLIDSSSWELPYLLAADSKGLIKRPMLVPTALIDYVSWNNKDIEILVPQHLLRTSPEMREDRPTKELERAVLFHYFSYFDRLVRPETFSRPRSVSSSFG